MRTPRIYPPAEQVRAQLDENAADAAALDRQISELFQRRDELDVERQRLERQLPRVNPPKVVMVLACTECDHAPFPIDSVLTDLFRHTMAKHGRRPTSAERNPVQA